jgi:hypothetical protein
MKFPDAERDLLPRRLQHVLEVDEDALRGLGAQVGQAGFVFHRAQVGAEQAVEHARLGEGAPVAAVRAREVGQPAGRHVAVLVLVGLDQLVGAVALVAERAFGERVDELGDVAARLPYLAGQDDRRVQAHDVIALGDHGAPPLALDVALELDAERAVVPCGPQATIDLAGRVDEAPSLAQADDGVEAVTTQCHGEGLHPAGGRRARIPW